MANIVMIMLGIILFLTGCGLAYAGISWLDTRENERFIEAVLYKRTNK